MDYDWLIFKLLKPWQKKNSIFREKATSALTDLYAGPLSWSNWNLEMLVFGSGRIQRLCIQRLNSSFALMTEARCGVVYFTSPYY